MTIEDAVGAIKFSSFFNIVEVNKRDCSIKKAQQIMLKSQARAFTISDAKIGHKPATPSNKFKHKTNYIKENNNTCNIIINNG